MISKNQKIAIKVFLGVIGVFLIWFLCHTIFITLSGLQDNIHQADVAVVLGNEVNVDGQPSDRLKARLDKAVQIFQDGETQNMIVSGGMGKEGFDEATVMAEYLIVKGVPKEDIVLDSAGINTEATAVNSAKIMAEHNWHSAIVISQYFHISRIKLAFQKNGVSEIYSASASYFELRDLYSVSREFFGYYAYLWNWK